MEEMRMSQNEAHSMYFQHWHEEETKRMNKPVDEEGNNA